jgi:hypothetical protein
MSFEHEMDAQFAAVLLNTNDALYRSLQALVAAGQTKRQIMDRVGRVARGTLTAGVIEATVMHLIRLKKGKAQS